MEAKVFKLYNDTIEIKFRENPYHSYWLNDKRIPDSVTGATGIVDKSGPLMYWAVNKSRDYLLDIIKKGIVSEDDILEASKQHRIFKKKAGDIGTKIHEWVSDWILKKNPEMPEDPKVVNGITAFLKFQKEHKVKWTESERIVYSKKHNYCGFLDAMGTIDGELWLIDFKSSKGIYPPMHFQVGGYQIAWEEEMKKKVDRRMILKFGKEDGSFEAKELPKEEEKADKKAFLSCLDIKRRVKALDTYNK